VVTSRVTSVAGRTGPTYPERMDIEEQVELDTTDPQPDPHYLELLRGSKLPSAYLPPTMAGPQKPWVRASAAVVIACFTGATTCGVCLTYGSHLL
jgi:hypothetical protein